MYMFPKYSSNLLLVLALIFCTKAALAQNNSNFYQTSLPSGIYKSKADFLKGTPSDTVKVVPKGLTGLTKKELATASQNCYFYELVTDKKITNVFAVVYGGNLFFQINGILKNRNKTDRAQQNNQPNGFVAVLFGGNNFLYTEAQLVNGWAYGAMSGSGVAGSVAAQGMIDGKGVVWDFKNSEFNIFKNCKDFNEFIKDKNLSAVQECGKHQPDMLKVRESVKAII